MGPGTQLIAPEGFGSLVKGETYYVVAIRPRNGSALLAWFERPGEEPRVHFLQLATQTFEQALLSETLLPAARQAVLPPWLIGLEGIDVAALESARKSRKKSYSDRAEERYQIISPLVQRHELIVTSADPYLTLRRLAAEHAPRQKVARIAPWYVAYVIFSRSIQALMPSFDGIGTWKRDVKVIGDRKLGRPAAAGLLSGHSAIPLAQRCCRRPKTDPPLRLVPTQN